MNASKRTAAERPNKDPPTGSQTSRNSITQDLQTPVSKKLPKKNTLSQEPLIYEFRPAPTEPLYIPLRDGLQLHRDVELWVNEEVNSGQPQLSTPASRPKYDNKQRRANKQKRAADQQRASLEERKELVPQKKAARWKRSGWQGVCSGLAIVGITILVAFYLQKYRYNLFRN